MRVSGIDSAVLRVANATVGYLSHAEGHALYETAAAHGHLGPIVEIGSYCGKSTCFLGAGARVSGTRCYAVDHHRGSFVMRQGQALFDPALADEHGECYTLPRFVATISSAGLSDVVEAVVATSTDAEPLLHERGPFGMVFIDGEHDEPSVLNDWRLWSPLVADGGVVAFHDVNPTGWEGDLGPIRVWEHEVMPSSEWVEILQVASLRVARRIAHA